MGDYIYNRLFCVSENGDGKRLPGGGDDWVSMPGVWTYKGICKPFASGFLWRMENTCIYLCSAFVFDSVFLESLCKRTEGRKTAVAIRSGIDCFYDSILYLADVDVFPRRTSDELLLSKSVVYGKNFDRGKRLKD